MQYIVHQHDDDTPTLAVEQLGPRVPLYTPEFAADPHAAYREMRSRYGTLVPVELWPGISATLVIGYHTAVRILNDPEHFSADPRAWQKTVPANLPIMPMIEWRPNALRTNGNTADHHRYRQATNDALRGVDLHGLRANVERNAVAIINSFCADGSADLLAQYCLPLVFSVLNEIIGCPPEIGERVAAASAALFEGVDTATVNNMLDSALLELTHLKRREPGDDIATRLVQHPSRLTDLEMIHQLVTCYSAGIEIPQNLIANSLLLMLTDAHRFSAINGFPPSTQSVLDEILTTDPPLANYCLTYPRQPMLVDGVWLPVDQPVITSMAACNNSPEINTGEYAGNGWHLGWGTGPHACPSNARSVSQLIARDAIDQLLDALPELALAVAPEGLTWRPGPFHRALEALPVTFPPSPRLHIR
ncbi:Cytochrome P450 107B1 [Nocardia otitidiscaviarum]|uniref:Cytochrome P450 107B1 n=1 Tax=Nocardia otitidiscaviarum TaxID=1823 RepID=A0A379JMG8_9NOCA|nr:Cytochrome P450 107B1 [Nocardia otitidiscaviarum]